MELHQAEVAVAVKPTQAVAVAAKLSLAVAVAEIAQLLAAEAEEIAQMLAAEAEAVATARPAAAVVSRHEVTLFAVPAKAFQWIGNGQQFVNAM